MPGPDELHTLGPDAATLERLRDWIPRYGPLFTVRSRDRRDPSLVVTEPGLLKQILLTRHERYAKGVGFERVKMLLGNGIIVSDGEDWRRQRTMMQPGFSRANIARLAEDMRSRNLALRADWSRLAIAGEPVDITAAMSHLGLDIILRAILSEDLDRLCASPAGNPFAFLATDATRDLQTALRFRGLARHLLDIVEDRRRSGRRPFDLLSFMLEARDRRTGEGMTDKELLDEINTLIIAGHETSAGTLNWTWWLLAQNPAWETRILRELATLAPGDDFTFEQLMSLEDTANVLKETLRLYPPVWLFSRRVAETDDLGGHRLAPGTHLFITPYLLHRQPALWPDPERFAPERFDERRSPPVDRFAFIPFSAGARRCIGEYFSFVEMQMHLALLLPHFHLEPLPDQVVDIEPAVNLRTRYPLRMQVIARRGPGP
jgi:cytochrome P450